MGRDIWAERVYPVSRNLLADALGEHVGALPVHRDHSEHLEVALAHEDVVGGVLDDRAMEQLPEVLHRVRDRRRTAEGQAVVVGRQLRLGRREVVHFDLDALALGVLARRDAGEVEGVRARREEQLRSGAHTRSRCARAEVGVKWQLATLSWWQHLRQGLVREWARRVGGQRSRWARVRPLSILPTQDPWEAAGRGRRQARQYQ